MSWKLKDKGGKVNLEQAARPDADCHRAKITGMSARSQFAIELLDPDRPRRVASARLPASGGNGLNQLWLEPGAIVWVRLLPDEICGEIVAPISGCRHVNT